MASLDDSPSLDDSSGSNSEIPHIPTTDENVDASLALVSALDKAEDRKGPQIAAKSRRGDIKLFDVSPSTCLEFGFLAGDRVQTPKGLAWVVGVHGKDLYFQLDGDAGASKWAGFTEEIFKQRGFVVVFRPSAVFSPFLQDKTVHQAPSLASLVNSFEYSDVTFILDNGIKVHAIKGLLVSRSEYFKALFTNKTKESEMKEIALKGIDQQSLIAILTYLYTGSVRVCKENCVALLQAADQFLLNDVKILCAQELTKQVTPDTVLDILILADQRCLSQLKSHCISILLENLDSPSLRSAFKAFLNRGTAELTLEIVDALRKRKSAVKGKKRRRTEE